MGEDAILVALVVVLFSYLLYWSVWSLNGWTGQLKIAKQRRPKAKAESDSQS
jgi:cytochrome c-type biogenesis protein CcmH/NrfG